MDPQTLIFDVSSDEEFGFDSFAPADDFDWISKLLDDVTGDTDSTCRNSGQIDPKSVESGKICDEIDRKSVESGKICNRLDDVDDDDDVVVVGEVIVKPKRAKRSFSMVNNNDDDDDDDCVVLECDPDKPPPSSKTVDNDGVKDEEDDNSDDLVVVSEKGQVACRDFPHSRHLCANFPFSSTSHESRCELCHCYVCDSLAPCAYWGSGALDSDHCHATDKAVYWQTERRKFRQLKNPSLPTPKPVVSLPQFPQHAQASPRPCIISRNCAPTPFGVPNMVSRVRSHRPTVAAVARNGYHPHLVSRQLVRACNTDTQVNQVAQLAPRMTSRPIFKRTGLSTRPGAPNRAAYCSPNNVSVAFSHQQQLANKPVENGSANLQVPTPRLVQNPVSRQSNTRTLPSHGPGYMLPTRHTQTTRFPGCGQPAPVASDYRYTNPSMHQAQSISTPLIPCNASSAVNRLQCSQQHFVGTQNISVPDFPCSTDMLSNNPQMSHQALGVTQECSTNAGGTLNAPTCIVQNPQVDMGVSTNETMPSMEKDAHTALDFNVESWLDENGGDASFFDMSSQPSQTVPIDTGMLFFDFETSWQGLAHS